MNERQSDFEWLQQFARAGNQSAFRDLVRRHIDLVFATALRKVGDAGGAEEISQNVFGALAKKAWQFAPDDSLPAWLHKTALLESQAWQRGEMRRRQREQTAAELGTTMKTPDEEPAFRALVPLLDEALLSLREKDREALLLRYYESQSLKDVGATLGISDDTAQKRVQTALEKLSQFFQRRGFKTATVAITTAALQHTTASASAATVSLVFNTALQTAPPALVGITALLARFASLTKVQTAAVCVAVAAVPLAWQWNERNDLRELSSQAQLALDAGKAELAALDAEIAKLKSSKSKRETEIAEATAEAAERAALTANIGDWRKRLRERLLAADYQWPEDLSLVRIPKAVVPEMDISRPILRPGKVATEARELMGLTPDERRQTEDVLQNHFAVMDKLAGENFYETNSATRAFIPKHATVSNVWVVPKLGDAASQQVVELKTSMENILRGERWEMVGRDMGNLGLGTLDIALGLNAPDTKQEIAGWLVTTRGEPTISFYISGSISDNNTFWSSGSPPVLLRDLADNLEGGKPETGSNAFGWEMWWEMPQIPQPVKNSMLAWMRKVAGESIGGGAK